MCRYRGSTLNLSSRDGNFQGRQLSRAIKAVRRFGCRGDRSVRRLATVVGRR